MPANRMTVIELRHLDDLRALAARPGPWVSAAIEVPVPASGGGTAATTWQALRHQAVAAGAPPDALSALDDAFEEPGEPGTALVALAAPDVLARANVDLRAADGALPSVHVGDFARVLPLLRGFATRTVLVAVLLDRVGADIHVLTPDGTAELAVEGDTEHVHKGAPGGWSQRRFQTRAELTWDRNAAEVSEELAGLVREAGAALVAVSGDERARGHLRNHLPPDVAPLVHEVRAGGRNEPDAAGRVAGAAAELAAEAAMAVREQRLAELRQELGQEDRAVTGAAPTFDALGQRRVATLFVVDAPVDGLRGYGVRPDGPWAASAETLGALGLEPDEGDVRDVAVCAALRTGAEIVALAPGDEPSLRDGLAAVLRYA